MSSFEVRNSIPLTVTVCIASFKGKGLCQSHATAFSWNGQVHGQFLQVKSRVSSSLPHHHPHRAWLVAGIFHTGEVWHAS